MTAPQEDRLGWAIEDAERLLLSLRGVVSARLVTRPGGEVSEIHVLTTDEVTPKQTVRNVESALLAHLGLEVDHRKISVAQTKELPQVPDIEIPPVSLLREPPRAERRLLFVGHSVETERARRVKHRVEIEWGGRSYMGEASAADLPRARLEAVAQATLDAVERAMRGTTDDEEEAEGKPPEITLQLDGVKNVGAFDRQFTLVAVHAMAGRDVTQLAGAAAVEETPDRATILATLQATDRWVRGRA